MNRNDDKNKNNKPNKKNANGFKGFLIYLSVPLAIIIFSAFFNANLMVKDQRYSDVVNKFKNHEVVEYDMNIGSGKMEIKLNNGETIYYTAPNALLIYADIKDYIKEYNDKNPSVPMNYDFIKPADFSLITGLIVHALFPLLTIGFMIWFFRRKVNIMGNKDSNFGKAKIEKEKKENKILFTDVAGADEEKQEVAEVVDFLKNPKKYLELGARIPKGILLIGPPGTGKTLLAKAVAGEANVPFLSISGSEFEEIFVGVGASRVKDLFDQAKKNSPSIIFIDEIDAVGRRRGNGVTTHNDGQSLNQMLVEMDGFEREQNVVVIAATNRVDVLDPALLRPGRFDRRVVMNLPDVKGREEILKVHARNKKFASDVDFSVIARITAGFTGADLENLLNEAAILAARLNLSKVTFSEIEEAERKIMIGSEKRSKIITEKDKKITAYHEAGHAIVTCFCENMDKVHEVSIIPRGLAAGYTMHLPQIDDMHLTKKKMLEKINVYMGGRVAESLIFGEDYVTTGASSDIEQATKIAKKIITKYGMNSVIGPVCYYKDDEDMFFGRYMNGSNSYSEDTASKIDFEIKKILKDGYNFAKKMLETNMEKLHNISEILLKNEKLSGEEFYKIMDLEDSFENN